MGDRDKIILGLDVGGTFTKIGIKKEKEELLFSREKLPTPQAEHFLRDIQRVIDDFLSDKPKPDKIGFALPADVDCSKSIMLSSVRFKCGSIPFSNLLPEAYKTIPAFGINDGQAAGLGELVYGEGKEVKNFLFISLGTNVGGAIIFNGRLLTHDKRTVGRIAHLCIDMNGPMCRCGQRGCWEMYVSTTAIIENAKTQISAHGSLLSSLPTITPRDIAEAAEKNDEPAKQVLNELAKYLALGIANVANIIPVETIFIGGGISLAGSHLLEPLKQKVQPRLRYKEVTLLSSKLSDNAGLYGAIALAEKNGEV